MRSERPRLCRSRGRGAFGVRHKKDLPPQKEILLQEVFAAQKGRSGADLGEGVVDSFHDALAGEGRAGGRIHFGGLAAMMASGMVSKAGSETPAVSP